MVSSSISQIFLLFLFHFFPPGLYRKTIRIIVIIYMIFPDLGINNNRIRERVIFLGVGKIGVENQKVPMNDFKSA